MRRDEGTLPERPSADLVRRLRDLAPLVYDRSDPNTMPYVESLQKSVSRRIRSLGTDRSDPGDFADHLQEYTAEKIIGKWAKHRDPTVDNPQAYVSLSARNWVIDKIRERDQIRIEKHLPLSRTGAARLPVPDRAMLAAVATGSASRPWCPMHADTGVCPRAEEALVLARAVIQGAAMSAERPNPLEFARNRVFRATRVSVDKNTEREFKICIDWWLHIGHRAVDGFDPHDYEQTADRGATLKDPDVIRRICPHRQRLVIKLKVNKQGRWLGADMRKPGGLEMWRYDDLRAVIAVHLPRVTAALHLAEIGSNS